MKNAACRTIFLLGMFLLAGDNVAVVLAGLALMVIGGIAGGAVEKRKSPNVGRR